MSAASPRALRRVKARKVAGTAIAMAALAGGLLTAQSAAAVGPATSLVPSLSSFTDWHEWVPATYDYALTTKNGAAALRFSNASGPFGNITQLSTPAITEVGEPSTGADSSVFVADFTIDAASYAAQPGLAVEVDADKSGNRSGGGVVFRQDVNGFLNLTTYWADAGSEADDPDWNYDTESVAFAGPLKIRYVAQYNSGVDTLKVYVNNVLAVSGEGFEAYHNAVGSPAQTVDSLLFRTSRLVPDTDDTVPGAWIASEPTSGQQTALQGKGFYFSGIEYGATDAILAPAAAIAVQTEVSGTAVVGGTLTASTVTNAINPTLKYQWLREGVSIVGAPNSANYLIGSNDLGKRISVKVTATKTGSTSGTATSAKTDAVLSATFTSFPVPTITGTAQLGSTLTANGASTPAGSYTYQWYRGDSAIKSAVAKTYKLATGDVGREVTVKVTSKRSGYATASQTSLPTDEVLPGTLIPGTATIAGKFAVGRDLTVTAKGWTPTPTLKYAFYADGDLVQFGPSPIYRLTWEEEGKRISVIVSGSKRGYDNAEGAETAPRGPVLAAN